MDVKRVDGQNKGKIFLFALSTCGWCRKTKAFLNEQGLAYEYVDVDLEVGAEKNVTLDQVRKWNPSCSFPTIVVNDSECIVGYQPDKLKELLKV